jgi:hypothetical protein
MGATPANAEAMIREDNDPMIFITWFPFFGSEAMRRSPPAGKLRAMPLIYVAITGSAEIRSPIAASPAGSPLDWTLLQKRTIKNTQKGYFPET